MTEKEKAVAGLLYDGNYDRALFDERTRASTLCQRHNQLPPNSMEERREILRELLGKTGNEFLIMQPLFCDYGYNIEIGENFFSNFNCVFLDSAKISFGDNVFIGPGCGFYCPEHPLDAARRNKGLEWAKPITVGSNVWFGGNVTVLGGVTIGDGAVIGAGSVVAKDVPPYVLAVGNPCRVIREISHEELSEIKNIR